MSTLTFGFIGLGLIGGSIAKAIRDKMPDTRIIAYDPNEASLQLAHKDHVANEITSSIDGSFQSCDYIFLCAPVAHNDENMLILKQYLSRETIFTDVGSVKSGIIRQLES